MWQSRVEIEGYSVAYFDCHCLQSPVLLNFRYGRGTYALRRFIRYSYIYEAHMSSALNGSSAIHRGGPQCTEARAAARAWTRRRPTCPGPRPAAPGRPILGPACRPAALAGPLRSRTAWRCACPRARPGIRAARRGAPRCAGAARELRS